MKAGNLVSALYPASIFQKFVRLGMTCMQQTNCFMAEWTWLRPHQTVLLGPAYRGTDRIPDMGTHRSTSCV